MTFRRLGVLALVAAAAFAGLSPDLYADGGKSESGAEGTKGTIGVICTDSVGNSFTWSDMAHRHEYLGCINQVLKAWQVEKNMFRLEDYIGGINDVRGVGNQLRELSPLPIDTNE